MADSNTSGVNIPPQFKKLGNNIVTVVIVLVVALLAFTSFFQVDTEEVGVITRFGKYVRTVEPGLHMKLPLAETVYKVPVERQLKEEFGFRTVRAGVQTQYDSRDYSDESLMLTGDLNLAEVEWVVQYRIEDPYKYLFKVRNPQQTLRDIAETSIRQIVGDRTVNEVLTVGRAEVASQGYELVQKLCDEYTTGIQVEQVVLQDVNPPEPVKAAFNKVNEAQQQKETLINEAKSEYNKVIPRARGEAEAAIQEAEGYATERINNAEGEAARFSDLFEEYRKAPEVTKRRIYLETLARILPKLGNKVITDENSNGVLPLLQMDMNKVVNTDSLQN